ncbi:exo-polygalacturonase, putative [Talaromyces stipitatus ATCC 10500]|uniref:galacturonan 1,4-alpha-galacturonidase n=1 Tax=Talaromyces stipitatus (strain ATCC 10500 / CBS 375.48 / QM 6759 / NRRL 1006) TaxID=441959 RepID=B8LTI1_TALSN|nr:exo-polygalacturonase, putative [Talaromyces stipitatus ATCC 10500]EED23059.1 exo-polygalacturonase, putative [Talaromyces stipitatus ATCC 10500]
MRILTLRSLLLAPVALGYVVNEGTTYQIYPEALTHNGQAVDDAPSIHQAFDLCGINGTVIFTNNTFHINSILNTTNLLNCNVSLRGELRFSTNTPYWKSHVYSVIYQNQSTAWLFGGINTWYTENKNQANQPGRPISITFYNSTNLLADGLTIFQPQFWATLVWQSTNVSLRNFYVNATSNDEWGTVNTDGYDSWRSSNLLVESATIINGDDCVAAKGNTTNLLVRHVTCHGSAGMTIGSIGQYPEWPDYVENVTFDGVRCINSSTGAYIKTWQGIPVDQDSNGDVGGGGLGLVKNVTFKNFEMINTSLPIQISQCMYSESSGACNTSKLQIEDVSWVNITGTSRYNVVASLYCSDPVPCPGIIFDNVTFESVNHTLGLPMWNTTMQDEVYQCANIDGQNSSGIPCNRVAPDSFGGVSHNVQ